MEEIENFEKISVCPWCYSLTEEKLIRNERFTFCTDGCGCLEGEKKVYRYICNKCDSVCNEPMCMCHEKKSKTKVKNTQES